MGKFVTPGSGVFIGADLQALPFNSVVLGSNYSYQQSKYSNTRSVTVRPLKRPVHSLPEVRPAILIHRQRLDHSVPITNAAPCANTGSMECTVSDTPIRTREERIMASPVMAVRTRKHTVRRFGPGPSRHGITAIPLQCSDTIAFAGKTPFWGSKPRTSCTSCSRPLASPATPCYQGHRA